MTRTELAVLAILILILTLTFGFTLHVAGLW